ncbi:aldose 1-epimerase family protein [Romboutsia lituseburensis]|uniref:aldose 1-epimerase family protein n=1 Tax=Romboutsia lituseburensis TaxID=1537 RepID=UPI00215A2AE2|nr:aldose 1-epimerase family protein [Romboutsia lituseburensis]MCR8746081.1 aldose 1-epimerase family protein [Romboutsia lituseburensis]
MNILENENLIVESKNFGAEITRIFSKKANKEILWNGDSKFWGRHSPILFPLVGRLKDNETLIENDLYHMSQHGFARDMFFDILNSTQDSITYKLSSNKDSKKLYPYSFELLIKYTLKNASLEVEWTVINADDKSIFFSIGAHPAFNLNFNECNSISDYVIEFKHRDNVSKISLDGPYSSKVNDIGNINNLSLNNELFINDALIYTNIDEISLKSSKSNECVTVKFKDFPLVGIWTPYYKDTKTTAPFICIEPWYGLADNINSNKEFKNKEFINILNPKEKFCTIYSIEI